MVCLEVVCRITLIWRLLMKEECYVFSKLYVCLSLQLELNTSSCPHPHTEHKNTLHALKNTPLSFFLSLCPCSAIPVLRLCSTELSNAAKPHMYLKCPF